MKVLWLILSFFCSARLLLCSSLSLWLEQSLSLSLLCSLSFSLSLLFFLSTSPLSDTLFTACQLHHQSCNRFTTITAANPLTLFLSPSNLLSLPLPLPYSLCLIPCPFLSLLYHPLPSFPFLFSLSPALSSSSSATCASVKFPAVNCAYNDDYMVTLMYWHTLVFAIAIAVALNAIFVYFCFCFRGCLPLASSSSSTLRFFTFPPLGNGCNCNNSCLWLCTL